MFILWSRFTWWKRVNENWDIIKNGQDIALCKNFTSTCGCFNSLRDNFYWHCYLKLTKEEIQCQERCRGYFSHPLDDVSWSPEAHAPVEIVVEARVKNCNKTFQSLKEKEWKVTFWNHNFKWNPRKHHFVYFMKCLLINCDPDFLTYLYFSLV